MVEITGMFSKIRKGWSEGRGFIIYYIGIMFLVILFLLFMLDGGTGITGIIGRTIGFLILGLLGYSLIDWNLNITENGEVWQEKKKLDKIVNLRMRDTSKTLERACKGEKTCQRNISEKIRNIFFIKLKEKKDLTDEELQTILQDKDRFRRTVQDEVISDFILATYSEDQEDEKRELTGKIKSFFSPNKDPKEYKKEIEQIIRRIERWD